MAVALHEMAVALHEMAVALHDAPRATLADPLVEEPFPMHRRSAWLDLHRRPAR